ncbi:MAG: Cyclopropane-fatty-acyl-phospholipid synthase [Alphaproteobacteria bacterium MarineAlpha2_Bin1]|nr:MAG: Cyclopropane-fatty-acyl-phospholipid synthase [Alphaproteobacteria bacterium MarineAlpha2_Bin1]
MLKILLNNLIKKGTLRVIHANGAKKIYQGKEPGPDITIKIHNKKTERLLSINPSLTLGETFMDGGITIESGDIYDFLELCIMNIGWGQDEHWLQKLLSKSRRLTRRIAQHNPISKSKSNVAHHYDLSDTLYDLFLDKDRQYSCAYYMNENESLETAQNNKKRHITAKLLLDKNHEVLDIGSGWGGLGLYIAEKTGAKVTGITLSEEQLKVSNKRAENSDFSNRINFRLQDYRNENNLFDRIVSVGMFEHVGVGYYKNFFEKIKELLKDDGVALIHTIGRADGPGSTNPWLAKYIFPGGYTPSLSEIVPIIEKVGLYVTDIEILRLHYASTLRAWRRNFNVNRKKIKELYDEKFCRMWDFYLAGCENAFRYGGQLNFQIQLAKKQDTVPLTRDYIMEWEQKHI